MDWITSFDLNNNSEFSAEIIEYKFNLYLSLNSCKYNSYFWLAKIDIISGTVIKSKWFKVFSGYLKCFVFNVVMVSDNFLFTLQESMLSKSTTASINHKQWALKMQIKYKVTN